jgi:hypothetical protein
MKNATFTKIINVLLIAVCAMSVFLGSWYIIHGDISFYTDIARDFLLWEEIAHKYIILVGPRADWKGLFHGHLWLYINFPAYILGGRTPLGIGWWWVLLTVGAGLGYYFAFKKVLKDKQMALIFTTLFFLALSSEMWQYYNPTGAILTMPFYFLSAYQYFQTKKLNFLLIHLFLAGVLIQFELAVGIPFTILSTIWVLYFIWKHKLYKHLLAFLIILIPTSTFILYNLKYHFPYFTAVYDHFSGRISSDYLNIPDRINNRIDILTKAAMWFFKGPTGNLNTVIALFIFAMVARILSSKEKNDRVIAFFFLYFYVGYFVLSFVHSGWILNHYYMPLMTLPFVIFALSYKYVNKYIFYGLLLIIAVVTLSNDLQSTINSKNVIGKSQTSWKFLEKVIQTTYDNTQGSSFGVYVYAPDVYAYAPKAAIQISQKTHTDKQLIYNKKMKETYLIYEPAPKDRPELDGINWRSSLVKINKTPVKIFTLGNGYRVEKYVLDDSDLQTPSDPSIDDWVSQR